MKCSACENNKCEGKYENRDKCVGEQEGIECTCICRITHNEAVLSSALSIGTGVAVTAAGIGLTVATGGMAAIIAGAAIAGSGTSLVFSPIQKYMSKEHVTLKESAKDVAIGATIGGITGPIGAIGSIASKGASAAVQIGARILAGSSAGAVTGVLSEGAKAMQGEEVTLKSVTHSAVIGAAVGTIGGASSQIARGVTKPITNEIGRAVTRVAVQGSSAAVTEAGVQLVQNGTVDPTKLILNTTGKMTLATTAEVSRSVTKHIEVKIADSHNKKHVVTVKSAKSNDEIDGNKNVHLEAKQVDEQEKNQEIQKTNSDLQEKVKPQNISPHKQQHEVQLTQNSVIEPEAADTFDQKFREVVNSTGSDFNGMLSNISSQLKNSYDRVAGIKTFMSKDKEKEEDITKNNKVGDDTTSDKKENSVTETEPSKSTENDSSSSRVNQGVNDQSEISKSAESTDMMSNDESSPLLINIDYDLLLEAQNSDNNLNENKSDPQNTENSNNLQHLKILEHRSKPIPSTFTSQNNAVSANNNFNEDLEKLSSLVSKVIANMEVETHILKEQSPDKSLQLLSLNNDSETRVENENNDDDSCKVIQPSYTHDQIKLNDKKIERNEEFDDVERNDERIVGQMRDVANFKSSDEQQISQVDESRKNISDEELSCQENRKPENTGNQLRHRFNNLKYKNEHKRLNAKVDENLNFPSIINTHTILITLISIIITFLVLILNWTSR